MLKKGIYKCTDRDGLYRYNITIKAFETEKSYVIELIADDSRFPSGYIDMLFHKSQRAMIRKHGGRHPFLQGPNYFVIYPFQGGMPFLFELQETETTDKGAAMAARNESE